MASRDAQQKQLRATLVQVRKEDDVCEMKNANLFTYGEELLRDYRGKTAFDAILQAEPLTGLNSVEIENLLKEYRGKLSAERSGRP